MKVAIFDLNAEAGAALANEIGGTFCAVAYPFVLATISPPSCEEPCPTSCP